MNEKPDLSQLFSMLSNNDGSGKVKPEEILSAFMNSSTNESEKVNAKSTSNGQPSDSSNLPDMEMMMRLVKIIKYSQQDNPSKELLQSLKPFLNDTRKEKVDQYIQILGMTKALESLNQMGEKSK